MNFNLITSFALIFAATLILWAALHFALNKNKVKAKAEEENISQQQ